MEHTTRIPPAKITGVKGALIKRMIEKKLGKVPTAVGLSGRADPGLAKDSMPQTWRGVHEGDREYVTGMQRRWEQRQKLEERHPELAGDQRPILAHEGRYSAAPLRLGDPAPAAGHGHGHGHGTPAT